MRELEKSVKTKRPGSVEQDSTMGPNFAYRSFCPSWNLVGECLPPNPASVLLWQKQRHPPITIFTNEGGTE